MRVSTRSGRVEVVAEARPDVVVERGPEPSVDAAGHVVVAGRSDAVALRVPTGADVTIGTGSGSVRLAGRFGAVAVATRSGAVRVEHAERLDARTRTGRVVADLVDGEARVSVRSGRAELGPVGSAHVVAASGRVEVGPCRGPVRVRSLSGRVRVDVEADRPDVDVETVSGRVEVRVPAGVAPALSASTRTGSVRGEVPEGDQGRVAVRTVSGAVRLRAAR